MSFPLLIRQNMVHVPTIDQHYPKRAGLFD